MHFEADQFPIFVEGEIIERSELLGRAGELIAADEGALGVTASTLLELKRLCNAELRFDFPIEDPP